MLDYVFKVHMGPNLIRTRVYQVIYRLLTWLAFGNNAHQRKIWEGKEKVPIRELLEIQHFCHVCFHGQRTWSSLYHLPCSILRHQRKCCIWKSCLLSWRNRGSFCYTSSLLLDFGEEVSSSFQLPKQPKGCCWPFCMVTPWVIEITPIPTIRVRSITSMALVEKLGMLPSDWLQFF